MEVSPERGIWLRELAHQRGYEFPVFLARELGVSRKTVAAWFKGRAIKELADRANLCRLFNIGLDQLLNGPYTALRPPVAGPRTHDRPWPGSEGRVYNRRGSGWTQAVLLQMLSAMIPAYEEVLKRRGEDEVVRLLLAQLSEIAPAPRTFRQVTDAMRQALFRLDRARRSPPGELARQAMAPKGREDEGPKPPPEWHTGWLSPRQQKREKERES